MTTTLEEATRLAQHWDISRSRPLTVDNTLRQCTLTQGGWRLYGAATQVYYATRAATDAGGSLASGLAAPVVGDLNAAAAGSPSAAFAWGTDGKVGIESASGKLGGNVLPTDVGLWEEFVVPSGGFLNLYLTVASGSAAPVLVGPIG